MNCVRQYTIREVLFRVILGQKIMTCGAMACTNETKYSAGIIVVQHMVRN